MGYDRGDSFPFDFEHKWNSIWFRKSKEKLSLRSYPIQCEWKWKHSFLSVRGMNIALFRAKYPMLLRSELAREFGGIIFHELLCAMHHGKSNRIPFPVQFNAIFNFSLFNFDPNWIPFGLE